MLRAESPSRVNTLRRFCQYARVMSPVSMMFLIIRSDMTTLTQPSERHPVVLRRGVVGFIETEVHLLSPAKYVEVECRERYPTRLSREYVCWRYASTVIALLSRSVESLSWVVGSERGEGTNSANAGYLRMILFITACEPAVWLTNHVASRGMPVIVIGHARWPQRKYPQTCTLTRLDYDLGCF